MRGELERGREDLLMLSVEDFFTILEYTKMEYLERNMV